MEKLYDRIDWHNNTSPALNETNLNRMSKAVDDIDDRVVDIAGTVMETVPQIQEDLEEAQELLEDAEEISTHPPIIGQNGNWWTWDTSIDDYADSGVDAGVSVTIGTTETLPAGQNATVTNSGTATDPILNFGIPRGETGAGVPTGGTTGQVLKKASGTDYDTEWGTASSGGHTILNSSGTAMTQRGKLQIVGGNVKDDSTNDKTVVTVDRELTQAEYDALSTAEQNNGTNYFITDAPSSYTGVPQSMIGDAWATSHAYAVGDYCIDGNVLYKCKTAHTSSASYRPPYASYWDAVSVADEIQDKLIYDLSFIKGTDSFTDQTSSYNRYICSKTIGQSNTLIEYDSIRVVAQFVSSSNTYTTGCEGFAKYSDFKDSSGNTHITGFIPGFAYGANGYIAVDVSITPNQTVNVTFVVGKDIWNIFSTGYCKIYV